MRTADRPDEPGHLDLTKESDPESTPSARGEADDIRCVDDEEDEEETEWDVRLEIRASWRLTRRASRRGPPWWDSPLSRTEAFVGPSIVLSSCVGAGATPAATLTATAIAAAIYVGTRRRGSRDRD